MRQRREYVDHDNAKRSFAAAICRSALGDGGGIRRLAAGNRPPPGAFAGAPPQYTHFSTAELTRGFLALAFGSDLRIGARPRGIRRFDHPIRARVIAGGSVDRAAAMQHIIEEYARAGSRPALELGRRRRRPISRCG